MRVVATFNITRGIWSSLTNTEWAGFYFQEYVIDWSLYRGCKMKYWVETMHTDHPTGPNGERYGGEIRMTYQQVVATHKAIGPVLETSKGTPIPFSSLQTEPSSHGARWVLLESGWFDVPEDGGVSCVWMQGKADVGKEVAIALTTVVIARDE